MTIKELEKKLAKMKDHFYETAAEVLNITSRTIVIHEPSYLKDPKLRANYKSALQDSLRILELLDEHDD